MTTSSDCSNVTTRRIEKYDGQTISIDGEAIFELGNYLVGQFLFIVLYYYFV